MFKHPSLAVAVAAAITLPGLSSAEVEVNGYLKNETSFYTLDGPLTGQRQSTFDGQKTHAGDVQKFQNQARMFVNGDINDNTSWHLDLNLIYDTEAQREYLKGYERFSQYDWLREAYVDTSAGDWSFRLGKQQVVWGTADGIKLLDIINPTDFRHLMQDQMEDSRIPIWMINAEGDVGDNGNVQFIVSQVARNRIVGLNDNNHAVHRVDYNNPLGFGPGGPGTAPPVPSNNNLLIGSDSGAPFIMKGVDTITGRVNGFFNIGAAMGAVTTTFYGDGNAPAPSMTFTNPLGGLNPAQPEFATVGAFTSIPAGSPQLAPQCGQFGAQNGAACLKAFTEITNQGITNLIDADPRTGAGWDPLNPNSTWEYMTDTTFATFAAFTGMTTRYRRDLPDSTGEANLGLRYKANLDNGLNFSLNYFYAYDPNPSVNIHWEDPVTHERLQVTHTPNGIGGEILQVRNAAGQYYGAPVVDFSAPINAAGAVDVTAANYAGRAPQLVFVEDQNRIHNFGGSLDYALDFGGLDTPIVLRAEALYQKDVRSPVVDLERLANGDLTAALTTRKGDWFKYVIGVDVNLFTNLMVSGQLIQFWNLDFVDDTIVKNGKRYRRYTADQAAMHLSNGLRKGYEVKNFFSLFFSKPFGPSDEHRVNDIIIFEEGGGYWNRLDAEYTFTDELIGTAAWNHYWGDKDTLFGQFERASSIQVGLKYIFE